MHRINQFLPHASKFGFFFHNTRFVTSVFNPTVSKPRPPTVLRNAVYLWGISLSRDRQYTTHEALFLNRSLTSIHAALSSAQPQDTLHVLQAEILLAYYFFHNGRLIEGKFHSSAAVSLAVMCNLHKQGSNGSEPIATQPSGPLSFGLPAPRDPIEEGERIHAWWTTFILDKCWVVALGSPSTILEDDNNTNTRIDAPWPLDLEKYGTVRFIIAMPISDTDKTYWQFSNLVLGTATPCVPLSKILCLALVAPTLVFLLHIPKLRHCTSGQLDMLCYGRRVSSINTRSQPGTHRHTDIGSHQAEFGSLDGCIERFKQTLPSPERVNEDITHTLLLAHSLAHAATIQLHLRFVGQSSTSRSRCLAAANSIIRLTQILPVRRLSCLNPIMAVRLFDIPN